MALAARGRSKPGAIDKPWKDALALALHEPAEDGRKKLRHVADACVAAAMAGDVSAMKEIGDRMDGKARQPIVGEGEDNSLLIRIKQIAA